MRLRAVVNPEPGNKPGVIEYHRYLLMSEVCLHCFSEELHYNYSYSVWKSQMVELHAQSYYQ